MFDADAYLKTLEPPSIVVGGRRHVGRLLSVDQWFRIAPLVEQAGAGNVDDDGFRRLVLTYCALAFPQPWWAVWRRPVGRLLLALPGAAVVRAMRDFLALQRLAIVGDGAAETEDGSQRGTS